MKRAILRRMLVDIAFAASATVGLLAAYAATLHAIDASLISKMVEVSSTSAFEERYQ